MPRCVCLTDVAELPCILLWKSFHLWPLGGAINLPESVLGACSSVASQLESIMPTGIFGITFVCLSWAPCLAEDLSASQGCKVFVNVGLTAVWLSTTTEHCQTVLQRIGKDWIVGCDLTQTCVSVPATDVCHCLRTVFIHVFHVHIPFFPHALRS